jgi:hypothetical protein
MNKRVFLFALFAITAAIAFAQTPTAAELLRKVDENEIYSTIEYDGEMIIEYQNRRYVKNLKGWAKGNTDSFIEFNNPEDRGTKYLKTGGRLYVYSPDTEKVMLISGHMLKVETIAGRRFPVETEIMDLLRRGSKTTFIMRNVVLDRPIADSVFSQRNLQR